MKRKNQKTLSLLLAAFLGIGALCLPVSAAAQEPLLKNSGFESGFVRDADWTRTGLFGILFNNENGRNGKCGQIDSLGDGMKIGVRQDCKIPSDGKYEFSAYVRSDNAPSTNAILELSVKDQPSIAVTAVPTTKDWSKVTVSASFRAGTVITAFLLSDGGGIMLVDDTDLVRIGNMDPEPPVPPQPTNLLQNGSFESELTGWNVNGSAPFAFTTTSQAKSGVSSLYMGYFTSEPMVNYMDQVLPLTGAGRYVLSAYIKTDGSLTGLGAMMTIEAIDRNGVVLASASNSPLNNSGGTWKQVPLTLNAPAQTVKIRVKLGGISCTGAFYVDDVTLVRF